MKKCKTVTISKQIRPGKLDLTKKGRLVLDKKTTAKILALDRRCCVTLLVVACCSNHPPKKGDSINDGGGKDLLMGCGGD